MNPDTILSDIPSLPPPRPEKQNGGDNDRQAGVMLKTRAKTRKPAMYKVLLLNDDFTPKGFSVRLKMKQPRLCSTSIDEELVCVVFLPTKWRKPK
jgi:hypothetical protein